MNQSENTRKRLFAAIGILIFVVSATVAFQDCGGAVHVADGSLSATPVPSDEPAREPNADASTADTAEAAPPEELGVGYKAAEAESEFRRVAAGGE